MGELVNNYLVYLHLHLEPYKVLFLIIGALYLIIIGVNYTKEIAIKKEYNYRQYLRLMANTFIAAVILSYGGVLHIQDPDAFDYLFILYPICTCFLPLILTIVVWMEAQAKKSYTAKGRK